MSLFNRRSVMLAPLAVAACGFTPVYGPGGTGTKLQNNVLVAAPENRDSFLLVRRIEERLGRSSAPAFDLSLSLETREEGLGIDSDGNTDRFNLIGVAGYALSNSTGDVVTSGTVNSFTGYSATGNTTVTLAAERDARERLMVILADQIVARLLSASLPTS
ncbi:MAG: LPS assembly lipoprotein LptE [Aliishimia sp.]